MVRYDWSNKTIENIRKQVEVLAKKYDYELKLDEANGRTNCHNNSFHIGAQYAFNEVLNMISGDLRLGLEYEDPNK